MCPVGRRLVILNLKLVDGTGKVTKAYKLTSPEREYKENSDVTLIRRIFGYDSTA